MKKLIRVLPTHKLGPKEKHISKRGKLKSQYFKELDVALETLKDSNLEDPESYIEIRSLLQSLAYVNGIPLVKLMQAQSIASRQGHYSTIVSNIKNKIR